MTSLRCPTLSGFGVLYDLLVLSHVYMMSRLKCKSVNGCICQGIALLWPWYGVHQTQFFISSFIVNQLTIICDMGPIFRTFWNCSYISLRVKWPCLSFSNNFSLSSSFKSFTCYFNKLILHLNCKIHIIWKNPKK